MTLGEDDPVIRELSGAVERSPEVIELRLHLAGLLADHGRYAEALRHCSEALTREAGNANALSLLQRCSAALAGTPPAPVAQPAAAKQDFDWSNAEQQVAGIIEPAFIETRDESPPDAINENDLLISPIVLIELNFLQQIKRIIRNPLDLAKQLRTQLGVKVCDHSFPDLAETALYLVPRRGRLRLDVRADGEADDGVGLGGVDRDHDSQRRRALASPPPAFAARTQKESAASSRRAGLVMHLH